MTDKIRARYRGGVLEPLEPLHLAEGTELWLSLEPLTADDEARPFWCAEVRALSALFCWRPRAPGPGQPGVAGWRLRWADRPVLLGDGEDEGEGIPLSQAPELAWLGPEPGSLLCRELPLLPSPRPRRLYFALEQLDERGGQTPLGVAWADVPAATVAFRDAPEAPEEWHPEATWGRIDEGPRRGVWTDSPQGDYPNNANYSLTSRPVSLEGLRRCALFFEEKHALEEESDFCLLEIASADQVWMPLASFTGMSGWSRRRYDLSAYDGQVVRLRFRIRTDRSVTRDGYYLWDVCIAGEPA
ncbi:MAG TPA: antitoxin AF2212-like protein [Candidatus Nitrosotenuis sp.]|nr:antitoxin AF2212-like protein [Candidatus Nitrosotenuis sp.]